MKVKNAGFLKIENESASLYCGVGGALLVCVINGEITQKDAKYMRGEGFYLPAKKRCEINAKEAATLAFAELAGKDAGELGACRIGCTNIEAFERSLVAFCPDGEWRSANDSYAEGAAILLTSLFDKCEKSVDEEVNLVLNSYVAMAKRYIDANYSSKITVESVAESIGADRKYLRNLFFVHMGMSTKDYLMKVRMDKAKELLLSEMSIGDVALAVGYTDALGFSKMFKKQIGQSPSEFRDGETADKTVAEPKKPAPKKQKETADKPQSQNDRKREEIKYFLL